MIFVVYNLPGWSQTKQQSCVIFKLLQGHWTLNGESKETGDTVLS